VRRKKEQERREKKERQSFEASTHLKLMPTERMHSGKQKSTKREKKSKRKMEKIKSEGNGK